MISDKFNPSKLCKQLFIVSIILLIMTALRGLRFPNIWSYSHFLFDYEFGFMRRGIIGAVLGLFEEATLFSYEFFFIFSLLIFCANLFLLALTFKDLIASQNMNLIAVVMIFASSSGLIFLAHNIGYADHIGLLITLISLRITGFYKKLFFIAPALFLSLLVHEAVLVLFFPILFMSLFFTMDNKHQKFSLLIFSIISLLLFFLIGSSTIDQTQSSALFDRASRLTPVPLREDAFALLHDTGSGSLTMMLDKWMNPARVLFLLLSGLLIFPLVYFFQRNMWVLLKAQPKIIKILCLLAGLSPFLLHIVAWDTMRWNTMLLTTTYLMCYLAYQQRTAQEKPTPLNLRPSITLLILVVFINANAQVMLMDHRQVENFPYPKHITYLSDVFSGKANFPEIPRK
ncbi:MAG: hypothetical protein HRU20_27225 [Pseudomonadales bacterium]|nr:hypothetical protein [Pseudomonadales bacterium]